MAGAEVWSIKRCLNWCTEFLARHGEENPRVAAEWLLCAATGFKRIDLYLNHDRPLGEDELAQIRRGLLRRKEGEPLQYITGETGFRMLTIACEPGVLIPRPETELLVDTVLTYLDREVLGRTGGAAARPKAELPWNDEVERAREAEMARAAEEQAEDPPYTQATGESTDGEVPVRSAVEEVMSSAAQEGDEPGTPAVARVLEVGCGTGCISLSLASERRGEVTCVATDIEPRAVALAEKNRASAGLTEHEVDVRLGDLVAPVAPDEWETFDVLVSNPPYIPSNVMATLPREVAQFEPALALDGGTDGLDVFRRLLAAVPQVLRHGGLFACELHEESLDKAASLCASSGLAHIRVIPDLAGRPRFVLAIRP